MQVKLIEFNWIAWERERKPITHLKLNSLQPDNTESISAFLLCRKLEKNHSKAFKQQTPNFFSSASEKSMFYKAQVSGGHWYGTALDFLLLPNDLSSDISPHPQIVLLHPLLAPLSSPLSPQFSDKTLFCECNARCTDAKCFTGVCPFLPLCLISHLSSLFLSAMVAF